MSAHRGPVTNCVCCERRGRHAARGLVDACYARHKAAGTLDRFPRRNRRAADTREEHSFWSGQGLSDEAIARQLGISRERLDYALSTA